MNNNGDSLCFQENKDRQIHQKTYCDIKRLIAVVLILALISTVTYCIVLHEDHQITKRQEAVIAEDVIE